MSSVDSSLTVLKLDHHNKVRIYVKGPKQIGMWTT